jgi:TonB family protein
MVVVGVQPDGSVATATAESGDPLLVPSALEAARRWKFKPYPYEPGALVRTMRIEFQFVPPETNRLGPG